MLANSQITNVASKGRFDRSSARPPQTAVMPSLDRSSGVGEGRHIDRKARPWFDRPAICVPDPVVEISSSDIVKRRAVSWDGMAAEVVQATQHEKIEYRFH